jgi:hypothetical protein
MTRAFAHVQKAREAVSLARDCLIGYDATYVHQLSVQLLAMATDAIIFEARPAINAMIAPTKVRMDACEAPAHHI